jgi:hypothetical protein
MRKATAGVIDGVKRRLGDQLMNQVITEGR